MWDASFKLQNNHCDFTAALCKAPMKPTPLCEFFSETATKGPWKIPNYNCTKSKDMAAQAVRLHTKFKDDKTNEAKALGETSQSSDALLAHKMALKKKSTTKLLEAAQLALSERKKRRTGSFDDLIAPAAAH